MANLADLEYLRRQWASKQSNRAAGTQVMNQGSGEIGDSPTPNYFAALTNSNQRMAQQRAQQQQANELQQEVSNDNWLSKAIGFVDETLSQFGAGFVRGWEGLLDLAATGIGALGDATGWYDSQPFTDWAEQDLGGEAATFVKSYLLPANLIKNMAGGKVFTEQYQKDFWTGLADVASLGNVKREETYEDDRQRYYNFKDGYETGFGEFIGGAAQSIGFMLPSILTAGAGAGAAGSLSRQAISLGTMGASAAGKGAEEALNEGATTGQALGYGLASGGAEVASEIVVGKALGLVGLGTGKVGGLIGKGTARAGKETAKLGSKVFLKELGKTMFEEGMEEVSTAIAEPFLKSIYKGDAAFKDENGNWKNTSMDFWFGADGHFNESVLGQGVSGAVVGGLSSGVQAGSVVKKVGWDGYNVLQSFSEMAEEDVKLSKELSKERLEYGTQAYEEASENRTLAAKDFIENLDKFMQKATPSQKKELARYLTQDGALTRDLQADRNQGKAESEIIGNYLEQLKTDSKEHAIRTFRNFTNELQDKFGTDYVIEFDDNLSTNAAIDNDTKTIKVNPKLLESKGGALFAHEYIQHAIGHAVSKAEVQMADAIAKNMSKEWLGEVDKALKNDYDEIDKKAILAEWSEEEVARRKEALKKDEYVAYFLEDSFNQKNLDAQIAAIRQAFNKSNLIRRFINRLNGIKTYKTNKLATQYVQAVSKFVDTMYRAFPSNPLMLALAKEQNGIALTDAEKRLKQQFSDVFSAVKSKDAEAVRASRERGKIDSKGFVLDEDGKRMKVERQYTFDELLVGDESDGKDDDDYIYRYKAAREPQHTTVADKRIEVAESARQYYLKPSNPFFNEIGDYSDDMVDAVFEAGYDAFIDTESGDVYIKDDNITRSIAYERGYLGDKAHQRSLSELSNDEFKDFVRGERGLITLAEQNEYIEEIERRGLFGTERIKDEVVHFIPAEWQTRRMQAVADYAKKQGADVVYFSKHPNVILGEGTYGVCNYFQHALYVDASEVSYSGMAGGRGEIDTADQIARHELGHYLLDKNRANRGMMWIGILEDLQGAVFRKTALGKQLKDIYDTYLDRWGKDYAKQFTYTDIIIEEMCVQLWSESVLLKGNDGRRFQNEFIRFFNNALDIDYRDLKAFRYSRKRAVVEANMSEDVSDIKIEPEKIKGVIPNEYVKAVSNLNNDKVYAYSQAIQTIRDISKEIANILKLNPKSYRIVYNEKNIQQSTKALFDLFNKKGVTANQIVEGLYDIFSDVRIENKGKGGTTTVSLIEANENLFDNAEIRKVISDRIADFTMSGKDSFRTKVAKREQAFVELYKEMRSTLSAYARDMRARIDPTHTLRQTIRNIADGLNNEISLNGTQEKNALTLRTQMGSVVAAPFLNIPYKRNGNFGTLLKNQQTLQHELDVVLENYTQEKYDSMAEKPMFPFDADLRAEIQSFRNSLDNLPAPKTRKDGVTIYPNLTTMQIKQANKILKAIEHLHNKTVEHYSETLAPRVKGARKMIEFQTDLSKFSKFLTLNKYVFNAASFYTIINARLGNSEFAYNLTIGMELADAKRKSYIGRVSKQLAKKIEELGIKKELGKVVSFHGVEMQVDDLVDLYCGLKSIDFDNFDKNGVVFKDKGKVSHKIVERGQANQALKDVEKALSKNVKAYGDWLMSDLYNNSKDAGGFLHDYLEYKKERGYHHAEVSGMYYPQSADLSEEPSDVTQMVRAPKVFQNDKARVNHNHAFVIHSATRRVMQYANDLGTAMYVYPEYRENFYVLSEVWEDLGTNKQDIKFREALRTTLGMWVGLDVNGKKSVKGPMNFLIGNYTRSLLSFNIGTPFRQTISLLFSNFSLPRALGGVARRLFGSKAFKEEFRVLANEFGQMAYRSIGSENLKIDLSTGAGKITYYLRKLSDVGMKGIEVFDNITIQFGLASSMALAEDMGYKTNAAAYNAYVQAQEDLNDQSLSKEKQAEAKKIMKANEEGYLQELEYRHAVEEMFANFVETQIGSNPSNLSRLARGDSALGPVGQFASFMQGPMRAALAAIVDKYTTWRIVRRNKWTQVSINEAIIKAKEAFGETEKAYKDAKKALQELLGKKADIKAEENVEADVRKQQLEEIDKQIDKAKKTVDEAMDNYTEAKSELDQAEMNKKTFAKYKAMGGHAWWVSSFAATAVGALLNALIEAFTRKVKGKDEWDEWSWEEFGKSAITYGTVGWLPLANTITNAISGYDTSFPTGALLNEFGEIISAVKNVIANGWDETSTKALFREFVVGLSYMTGIPFKNIYNIFYGATKLISPYAAEYMHNAVYVDYKSNADIIKAYEHGNEDVALKRLNTRLTDVVGSVSDAVGKEMLVLLDNAENPIPSAIPTKYTNSKGEEVTITWTQQQNAKKYYSRANAIVARIISSMAYRKMNNGERAALVRSIYSMYRQAALLRAIPNYDGSVSKISLLAKANPSNMTDIILAVNAIKNLEATNTKSKKELAVEYVNKLSMPKNDKLLILYLCGYTVDESSVKNALLGKGMSYSDIKAFLGQGEK